MTGIDPTPLPLEELGGRGLAACAEDRFRGSHGWRTWIDFEGFADSWDSAAVKLSGIQVHV